jgi:hypothetical protein
MKKIVFIILVGCAFVKASAQTGIGTTTPDASAKLEVSATNKGFLPPRVALTATNAASPITSPANGLMVFNTATAGSSPYEVVPGYYYWDGTGLKWVSLSTTVGNVQNQGVFRSTVNTNGNTFVSSWNSRFNNIAAGDLTVTSNTSFALSNGIYKLEWALPYQQGNTYNLMVLQEYRSGTWASFLNDNGYAAVGNGGNTDWGGGTFAADIIDCSSSTRTFRLFNLDGSRALYYGANFIITKLNPAITTSTTADNLGNHLATKNVSLNGYYLSNDGGNEGIKIDNSGNVGINNASPAQALDVTGTGKFSTGIINSGTRSYFGKDGANMHWLATTDVVAEPYNLGYGVESNAGILSHRWNTAGFERMRLNTSGYLGIGTISPATTLHIQNANAMGGSDNPSSTASPSIYVYNSNNASSTANSTVSIRTAGTASGKPYLSLDIAGVSGFSMGINNPTDQLILNTTWNFTSATAANNAITINRSGQSRVVIPSDGGAIAPSWPSGWGGGLITYDFACAGIYYTSMTARSDRRLKNTIVDLDQSTISKYLQLRPVNFYWNDGSDNKHRQYGLIAQEVEELFPDIVSIANDSMQTKSVNYQALHALSLKVIQGQQAEIETLKKKQVEMEQRLLKIEAKLND